MVTTIPFWEAKGNVWYGKKKREKMGKGKKEKEKEKGRKTGEPDKREIGNNGATSGRRNEGQRVRDGKRGV